MENKTIEELNTVETEPKQKKKIVKRIVEIVTNQFDNDGNEILNRSQIEKVIKKHKTIKQFAYALHDKDTVIEEDIVKYHYKEEDVGKPKKPHWHIELMLSPSYDIELVAKWFNVPVNFLHFPKGKGGQNRGAFLDMVEYITHEDERQKELGKHPYADEEITANFDFRKELDERRTMFELTGKKNATNKEILRLEVLQNGMTLRQIKEKDALGYANDVSALYRLRSEYLKTAELPPSRINFYISGSSGTGKSIASMALARRLVGAGPDIPDEEIFFIVGGKKVSFDGYDGQPVIIYEDCRARTLLSELGSTGNVFQVFDPMPKRISQNVKYSSTMLLNSFSIINSIEPFEHFIKTITAGEDMNQGYRRFPIFIEVKDKELLYNFNLGVFNDDATALSRYSQFSQMKGNFAKLIQETAKLPEEQRMRIRQLQSDEYLLPVVNRSKALAEKMARGMVDRTLELIDKGEPVTDEQFLQMFRGMFEDAEEFAQQDAFDKPLEAFPILTDAEKKELGL